VQSGGRRLGLVGAAQRSFLLFPREIAWRLDVLRSAPCPSCWCLICALCHRPEVAAAARIKADRGLATTPPRGNLSGPVLQTTIVRSLMVTGCQGGYYAISSLGVRSFSPSNGSSRSSASTGYLSSLIVARSSASLRRLARRPDRPRNLFLTFSIVRHRHRAALPPVWTLTHEMLWVLGFPLGVLRLRPFPDSARFLTEALSDRLLAPGQGFCYNFRPRHRLTFFLFGRQKNKTILHVDDACDCDCDLRGRAYCLFLFSPPSRCRNPRTDLARET